MSKNTQNTCPEFLIKIGLSFQGANRLFLLSFKKMQIEQDTKGVPHTEIKDYVMTDGINVLINLSKIKTLKTALNETIKQ